MTRTAAIVVIITVVLWSVAAVAQTPPRRLPDRIPVADVEIAMEVGAGGGCLGRCMQHRIVIRGSGAVEYTDLGGEPRGPSRRRTIRSEQVVALLNEFLQARFFDALDEYRERPVVLRRENDLFETGFEGAVDVPTYTLSLRIGGAAKTVRLDWGYPKDLERLRDLVEELGGLSAWK